MLSLLGFSIGTTFPDKGARERSSKIVVVEFFGGRWGNFVEMARAGERSVDGVTLGTPGQVMMAAVTSF